MLKRRGFAPMLTALFLWSGSAWAGEARCLWTTLSPATQDRLLAAYLAGGPAAVAAVKLEPAESRRQVLRCAQLGGVVDPKRAVEAMGRSLQGYVLRSGASAALRSLAAHSDEQLDLAWREIGPENRARLHARAAKLTSAPAEVGEWGDGAAAVLVLFLHVLDRTTALPRTDPAVQHELEAYLFGRTLQEAFEPRF